MLGPNANRTLALASNYAGCKDRAGGPLIPSCTFVNPLQGIRAAAAAPARPPAANKPAEGQTEESHLAAMTSDDILCQLYGVDQDKEDAQYKVAFFDADAVLEAEALDRLLTEEGLFSSPSKKSFEDEPKSETSRARPDENETRRNGSGLLDVDKLVGLAHGFITTLPITARVSRASCP